MRTIEDRFWSKVSIAGPDDCWPWTAGLKSSGYGQFRVAVGESPQAASRVAWMLTRGHPGEWFVLHRCDNPPCCNPAHLFLGTKGDNHADMVGKGRQAFTEERHIDVLVERVRRLTDADIRTARRAHEGGESFRSIARRLGVAHTTIARLIKGIHWRDHDA